MIALRLLAVSETPAHADRLSREFAAAGFALTLRHAATAAELSAALAAAPCDLVLTALDLDSAAFGAVLATARAFDAHLPLIVMGDELSDEAAAAAMAAGARDVLRWDQPARLVAVVRRELALGPVAPQHALAESEARYRSLLESTSDWVWETDAQGCFTYAGPRVEPLLGLTPAQVLGTNWRTLVPPDEVERHGPTLGQAQYLQEPFLAIEITYRHTDGHAVVLESSGVPFFDEHGECLGFRGVSWDVTARKLAQDQARATAEADRLFAERLEALHQVTTALQASETVDDLARTAVELGRSRLGFERLSLWLHEHDGIFAGTWGTDEQGQTRDERDSRTPLRSAAELLARDARSKLQTDVVLTSADGQLERRGSHLGVALWAGDQVVGEFLADTLLSGRSYTEADQRLLELYAGRLAAMLGRVRAVEADRWLAAKLEVLYQLTSTLQTSETVDELALRAVELGRSRLGFDRLGLWLSVGDGHCVGTYGTDEHGATRDERASFLQLRRLPAMQDRQVRSDLRHGATLRNGRGEPVGIGSLLGAPLWIGDQIVGQITADNLLRGQPLDAGHQRLLELYAGRLAQLLSAVRSLEADRRFALSLEALHALTNELQREHSFDDLCRAAVVLGRERLGFDRMSIWLHIEGDVFEGSFGTDEQGQVRDERGQRDRMDAAQLSPGHRRAELKLDTVLTDGEGRAVGQGQSLTTAMWNRDDLVGLLATDNLLGHEPFTPHDCRVVELYAASLAQLFERKRAEEALRISEETYRCLFESSRDAIIISDQDGYLACNEAAVSMFGCASADEFLAKERSTMSPPFQPDGRRSTEAARGRVAAALGGQPQLFEWCHQSADGSLFPSQVQLTPMSLDGRTVLQVVVRDLTEQRRAEETQSRLMAAIEAAAEAVLITSFDGTILYVNAGFERMSGYGRAEVVGESVNVLKSGEHEQAFYQQMWECISQGSVWQGQMTNRRRDDSLYTVRATITPVLDKAGAIAEFVAIQEDVTDELELQAKLTRAQTLQVVGQLAGGIGHDFNNLLQVIMMCVEMAADTLPTNHPVHEDLDQVRSVVEGGADLVRKLLLFSRETSTDDEDLDLNGVIGDVAVLLRRTIGEDVDLRLDLAPTLPPIRSSKVGMQQVLMNLAVNARHAMDHGGMLRVATSQHAIPSADGDEGGWRVHLSVSDTGCGMTSDVLDHVFEPYFTTRREDGGSGLGLATVYAVVDKAGGRVNVSSQPGLGTTFDLYFPLAKEPSVELIGRSAPVAPDGHGETILVVEDEHALRRWLSKVLERHGYRVLEAARGDEALALCEQHPDPISLLLTDVVMPGMSGPQLAQTLLRVRPDLRVLFMSGYAEARHFAQGFGPTDANFLGKPFDAETVLGRLRTALAS